MINGKLACEFDKQICVPLMMWQCVEGAGPENETFDLPVDLRSNPPFTSEVPGSDQHIKYIR